LITGFNLDVDALVAGLVVLIADSLGFDSVALVTVDVVAVGFLDVTLDPPKNAFGSTALHEDVNPLLYSVEIVSISYFLSLLPLETGFETKEGWLDK